MISVKKQRIAAIMVLSSIVLTLLLSLNFQIWSGHYTEGDLESRVIQQMDSLEKSNIENNINERLFLHFYECICLVGIAIMVLWVYDRLKGLCQGEFSFRLGITLRSLSVRMDD